MSLLRLILTDGFTEIRIQGHWEKWRLLFLKLGLIDIKEDLFSEMIQYNLVKDEYKPDVFQIEGYERPPIIEIPAYREKFKK